MVMKDVEINPIGPITDYLRKIGDNDNIGKFIHGIYPIMHNNIDLGTLEECVKNLEKVHESIPPSETDVKKYLSIVLSMVRGYYDKAKKQEEYV